MEEKNNQIEIVDEAAPERQWIEEVLKDPNPTLPMLLNAMEQLDKGFIKLTDDQMVELGRKLFKKVDNYKIVEDELKAQIAGLSAQRQSYIENKIQPLDKQIGTLERGIEQLQGIMKFYMEKTETYQLPGTNNSVKLVERKGSGPLKIKPGFEKPNSVLFTKFPDYIERTYTWKKNPIKAALKAGTNVDLNDVAEVTNVRVLQWTVNKKPTKEREALNESSSSSAEIQPSTTH